MQYATIAAWAIDFMRAANERPLIMRLMFRFVLGKYAYREFIGLRDELTKNMASIAIGYDLKDMKYHDDKMPFDWGVKE